MTMEEAATNALPAHSQHSDDMIYHHRIFDRCCDSNRVCQGVAAAAHKDGAPTGASSTERTANDQAVFVTSRSANIQILFGPKADTSKNTH